jgi:uncharacterized protein YggU (UPF0235/DUF167 family)
VNATRPWKQVTGGIVIMVRATPKAVRDTIEGIERLADGNVVLKARVRAAPADGEANEALARLIARAAAVPPSAVSLVRGGSGRLKRFRLDGDPARIAAALEVAVSEGKQER